ncbi:MAG: hypothetical protein ABH862_02545, partial [Candidatus Omnitrophota bacterium]
EFSDKQQIVPFIIYKDTGKTEKSYQAAVKDAGDKLPSDGRIVFFAPQMKGSELAEAAQQQYSDQEHITVVPDAYTDARPEEKEYPDIMTRAALARHIAFYYNGNDRTAAIKSINDLLGQVSDNTIESMEDLLKITNALRINPIRFEEIAEWQDMQRAVATSL